MIKEVLIESKHWKELDTFLRTATPLGWIGSTPADSAQAWSLIENQVRLVARLVETTMHWKDEDCFELKNLKVERFDSKLDIWVGTDPRKWEGVLPKRFLGDAK